MLNLVGIKTPQGIYISNFNGESNYNKYSNINSYKVNGENPKSSFKNGWSFINEEPKIITVKQSPFYENHRYVLKDKSIASDKIPLQFQREEVNYKDDDYGWEWKEEYVHLKSLYTLEYDTIDQPDLEVEFTYEQIIETDELREVKNFDWDIYRTRWTHEGTRKVSIDDLKYRIIDEIILPEIYLKQKCPVTLPSKAFYDIIRYYIKTNIDKNVADITSDYDFCFTVKKKIKRSEPLIVKKEILKTNGRSYATPKFTTNVYQYASSYEIFKMTHMESKYKEYPILPDLHAENIDELETKVNVILDKLIKFINDPVCLCKYCNGTGLEQDTNTDVVNLEDLIK